MLHLNNSIAPVDYKKFIHDKLYSKYSSENIYDLYSINNILYNNKSLIVAKFKDFLLYEDLCEFLKRFYRLEEIGPRLKKLYNYFHKYMLIQPNYCLLTECKFMISNIFRKQIVMDKERKKKRKKKLINNKEKEDKLISDFDEKFFNSTLHGEILNQSESFMNTLFGIDTKNITEENFLEKDNDMEINDIKKLINEIEKSEVKKNNEMNENKGKDKKNHYKKLNVIDSKYSINNEHERIISNCFNSATYNTTSDTISFININPSMQNILNSYQIKKNLKDLKKDIIGKPYQKQNKNKEINTEIKEKNTNDNDQNKKNEKAIYHRKMKTSIIGEYLNQLDLPSNSNIINSLKKANEAFANNQKNSNIKVNLSNKAKFETSIKEKSKKSLRNSKFIFHKNFNSINITRENTINSNILATPMKKENTLKKISQIEIPKTQVKKVYILNNKLNPIYTRNHIPSGLCSSNSKKKLFSNNSKKDIKKNLLLTSLQNSEIKTNNKNNKTNIKQVYSKPKALYKYKTNGISVKRLFNKNNA